MAKTTNQTVLVTGASGLIGGLGAAALAEKYRVRALNRRPSPPFETVRADITDPIAIQPAFMGVTTVVHLAALLIQVPDRDLFKVNLEGTYNVFEAARLAGVKRVVFASSGAVSGAYHREEPFASLIRWDHRDLARVQERIYSERGPARAPLKGAAVLARPWQMLTHLDVPRPSTFYGYAKAAGEAMGRFFHEKYGLSVICIRFGAVTETDRPVSAAQAAVYMSKRDAAQAVLGAVDAPDSVGFEAFYALSDNAARFRDLERAHTVTGFMPRDGVVEWPLSAPPK